MKVHFIAIGGSVMHNLAIAMHNKGHQVSGSDDKVFEPSLSRLKQYGLLPPQTGWDENLVHQGLDAVILGMHALTDNPELKKALQLGLKIYSFPAFMYEQARDKKRIVIAGSHGKTTITSMVMHVFRHAGMTFDYLVGSQVEGFETMVGFSGDATYAVFEGDEYLTSPIDQTPKFFHYKPHIAVLSGIAWDHFNVFPTFENYLSQFEGFIQRVSEGCKLFFDEEDENIKQLGLEKNPAIRPIAYRAVAYANSPEGTVIDFDGGKTVLKIFGHHNMKNMAAAFAVCMEAGIDGNTFYEAMQSFKGAQRRLEKIYESASFAAYTDFAHAPSKVKATLEAVKDKYPDRQITAFLELHTFSSLNKGFLPQYLGTMDCANTAFVCFDPSLAHGKKLESLNNQEILNAFHHASMRVLNTKEAIEEEIKNSIKDNGILLFMSSGNFSGINIKAFVNNLQTL